MREEGFYWVKYKDTTVVAFYTKLGAWLFVGTDNVVSDDDNLTVIEKLVSPEEHCPKCKCKTGFGYTIDDGSRWYSCEHCGNEWEVKI